MSQALGPGALREEREVGGGIGMGNTCKPMAVSFQCMTKFITNKKKEIIKKKKKIGKNWAQEDLYNLSQIQQYLTKDIWPQYALSNW